MVSLKHFHMNQFKNTAPTPKAKRGRPKTRVPDVGATPETAAKLEADQLSRLLARGEISADHERAGRALHSFSLALQKGMSPRSHFDGTAAAKSRKAAKSPLERLSEANEARWHGQYRPWATTVAQTLIARRPRLTLLGLVQRVVDENQSTSAIARQFAMTEEAVLEALRQGLDGYNAQKREKKRL